MILSLAYAKEKAFLVFVNIGFSSRERFVILCEYFDFTFFREDTHNVIVVDFRVGAVIALFCHIIIR